MTSLYILLGIIAYITLLAITVHVLKLRGDDA